MAFMSTQDMLNIFLIFVFLIMTICAVFATYYFVQALKSITQFSDDCDEIAQNLKNKVQMKALVAIPALLVALAGKIIKKRG